MPRNGSGTYLLPAGINPVVADTAITTAWANGTNNDIASEITNSVAADGQKPMSAPLKHSDGSVSLPSITFNAEAGTGFYRATTGTLNATILGGLVESTTATTKTLSVNLTLGTGKNLTVAGTSTLTGAVTASSSLTVTGDYLSTDGDITLTNGNFVGNGSSLTNLSASALAGGVVPAARLSGTYGINISGNAATATTASACSGNSATATTATSASTATTATNASYLYINSGYRAFTWSGQGGTPSYLWGSNDGVNFYVWSPSNFSVNYATSSGTSAACSGNAATATSTGYATSAGTAGALTTSNSYSMVNLTASGNITASGNVTAYSDRRLKTDLTKLTNSLDKIEAIAGYTYTRTDTGNREVGVVAQELELVLPEAVVTVNGIKTVDYGRITALLIEGIKELRNELRSLK